MLEHLFLKPTTLFPIGLASICGLLGILSNCNRSDRDTTAQTADAIYTNGSIITVNDDAPSTEALAVKDGRILAVGTKDEVMKSKGDATKMIDLGGKAMLPGFIDAHGHIFNCGVQASSAILLPPPDGGVGDIASLQKTLSDWAAENEATIGKVGWIVGFGYDDGQLKEQRHPTREDLDAVSTTMPVLAIHQSGHFGVLNRKGLEMAGYTAATEDPEGGLLRRQEGSRAPNGVLEEMAFFKVVFSVLGTIKEDDNEAILKAGIDLYAKFGFTTAQEGRAMPDAIKSQSAVADAGGLKLDIAAYPDSAVAAMVMRSPKNSRTYSNRFRIAGVKISLDGSPQGKTAWLTQPYLVPPAGQDETYLGYPAMPDEKAFAHVDEAFKNGWQVLAHCSGDAAAAQLTKAVRLATEKYGKADRRTVMIHAHAVREDQLDEMMELGIKPSFFSMHTFYWGDWHRDSVFGEERGSRIAPAGSALKRGMIFTQHHDSPVALPSSIMILATQVNRLTGTGKVLGPDQRVPAMDAVKSITINAAYQYFEEDSKGSLEPGKLADLVILDQNPLTIDPLKIKDIKVIETIKEGTTIYTASE